MLLLAFMARILGTVPRHIRSFADTSNGWRILCPVFIRPTVAYLWEHHTFIMSESDNISALQGPAQLRLNIRVPALNERLYDLTDEERSFFKQQTEIQDDDELKAHILQVQAEAYKVCNL
jgi:hypothetical protein